MDSTASAHQRKIELQAPEDLSYLVANVRRAATARIDEAFPPVDGAQGEDELRTRIEELVDEYITRTFTLASPNLSINGMPCDNPDSLSSSSTSRAGPAEPETIYSPFDGRARQRVEDLTREEEDLLRDIASLKKSVPGAAAAAWGESIKASLKEDEDALAAAKQRMISDAERTGPNGTSRGEGRSGTARDAGLKAEKLERQEDIEKGYQTAVDGLGKMKREMPAVVAKMERARGAGAYVVTER
ncbi:hypothetical protein BJ170DRAFT_682929 [Xylariales sp. AK1849]|nr:hypothetical protein BJ170DRAFT_682929 [Xylariales sp. AK1849]